MFRKTIILMTVCFIALPMLSSCRKEQTKGAFNLNIEELDTDGKVAAFKIELALSCSWGSGEGQIAHNIPARETNSPDYVAGPTEFRVAQSGKIYVDDRFNNRVSVFDEDSNYLMSYPYPLAQGISTNRPVGMAVGEGTFYFVRYNGEVISYDKYGNKLNVTNMRKKPDITDSSKEWYPSDPEYAVVGLDGNLYFGGNMVTTDGVRHPVLTKCSDSGEPEQNYELGPSINEDFSQGFKSRPVIDINGNSFGGKGIGSRDGILVFDSSGVLIRSIKATTEKDWIEVLGIDIEGNLYCSTDLYKSDSTNERTGIKVLKYKNSNGELISSYEIRDSDFDTGYIPIFEEFGIDGSLYFMDVPRDKDEGCFRVFRIKL